MFDIGFWELIAIAIVALLIIGPEKLPKFARDAGHLIRKIRSFIRTTKRELEDELELSEIDKLGDDINHLEKLMKEAPDRFIQDDDKDSSTK